jgi:choline kinase
MRAIILAAGRGLRLQQPQPKCLLQFGGESLLARHVRLLAHAGITELVLVVGYMREAVAEHLGELATGLKTRLIVNERFELGSVLSLHTAAAHLEGDVLVMDADVLYHEGMLRALTAGGAPVNRLLLDRNFEPGTEPVKVCVRAGVPIELRKQLAADLKFDSIGESVGFFRLADPAARRLAGITSDYVASGRAAAPHEEALRDLLREGREPFEVADVTGIPWIEIDFPADIERARREILPRL